MLKNLSKIKIEKRLGVLRSRKDRVFNMWLIIEDRKRKYKCRCIYTKVDDELTELMKVWKSIRLKETIDQRDYNNLLVILWCYNINCKKCLHMSMKHYNELTEDPICATCGRKRITKEDFELKKILLQNGIKSSY